jgi:hypothetical protein
MLNALVDLSLTRLLDPLFLMILPRFRVHSLRTAFLARVVVLLAELSAFTNERVPGVPILITIRIVSFSGAYACCWYVRGLAEALCVYREFVSQ